MRELPKGWAECSLEDLIGPLSDGKILHQGWSPQCESTPAPKGEWGVLKTTAVQDGYFLEDENKALPSALSPKPELEVKSGDLLMTCAGPRSRCGVICHVPKTREKLIFSGKIYRFRPNAEHVEPKFLTHLLRTAELKEKIDEIKTGISESGMNMTRERFFALPVRLAPLAEQTRIAAKLDELLAQVDTLKARIDGIPALLKRFRQSVLAAAVSGRLTEEWRSSGISIENGHVLHHQIKEAHAAEGGHARGNASDPTEEAHDLSPEDLPKTWDIAELRDICVPGRPITYGILKPGPELEEGVPYIRVADFPGNKLNMTNIKKTSSEIDEQFRRARLIAGDLLLSIRGSVGRLIKIPANLEGANITQDTARLSISPLVSADFVYWALLADSTQRRMKNATRGVAVRGINIGDVRALQIPLPAFVEQTEIVRRVEQLFAFADQLEARVVAAKSRIDHLTQSILAKAFRGELVPQDPNDEPASLLLERIKAQRAAAPKAKRGRGKSMSA